MSQHTNRVSKQELKIEGAVLNMGDLRWLVAEADIAGMPDSALVEPYAHHAKDQRDTTQLSIKITGPTQRVV